jgi:radial spoke head protein 9
MDIDQLSQHLAIASAALGENIPVADLARLKLALLSFREAHKPDKVQFWGRIRGLDNDYYIMVASTQLKGVPFPKRQFFWSNDMFNFSPLPEVTPSLSAQLRVVNSYFTGDHHKIILKNQDTSNNGFDSNDDLSVIQKGNQKNNITELDRLSSVVHSIDMECAIVPYESQKSLVTGELLENVGYQGQKPEDIGKLSSYRHYRLSDEKTRLQILVQSEKKAVNTLETVEHDIPKSCWSILHDSSKLLALVRNFKWPGFLCYNRANTVSYGYCYFGDGRKVNDLMFTS